MKKKLYHVIKEASKEWGDADFNIEHTRQKEFGDLATNIAMVLSKQAHQPPLEIGEVIARKLRKYSMFSKVEVVKPGFINLFLSDEVYINIFKEVLGKGEAFFKPDVQGKRIQIEFVSANPTGPLHVGHGRGAAIGDALSRILSFCGHTVEKEYYINDAGNQIQTLGESVFFRYREICGEKISFPEYGYKGDYIKDIAQNIYQRESKSLLEKEEKEAVKICAEYASNTIMEDIKNDLKEFRINFTNYFHEIFLYPDQIEKAINYLKEKDLVYCKDNALWFKSTSFGDDKDRVLKKSDGSYTYFASDTAYHQNKLSRNYDELIDIWGADHHGYVSRIMAAFNALSPEDCKLHIILVQLVNLLEKGERISMSTRGGQFETLRDVIKEVGVDACRFMFLTKSTNTHLDFDIQIAKEQSMDNPVYYVQYAHARICNIFEQAKRKKINIRENVGNYILKTEEEKNIVKELVILREAMDKSVQELEPFYVVKSLINIACAFHQFYNRRRVIGAEEEIMQSRFKLIDITKKAISTGLSLIGVSAPKQM